MTHGNTVVDGDSVEFGSIAAKLLDLGLDDLTNLVKVSVTRDELCKRIDDSDDWLAKLLALHTIGYPKGTGASHAATHGSLSTSKLNFHICLLYFLILHNHNFLSDKRDSNPRLSAWEADALPTELLSQYHSPSFGLLKIVCKDKQNFQYVQFPMI